MSAPSVLSSHRRPRQRVARRAIATTLVGAAAVLLSGCYSIVGQSTEQQGVIGDLAVTTELCIQGPVAGGGAPIDGCASGAPQAGQAAFQQYVGYLVPAWVKAPDSVSATLPSGPATFARSQAYEAALATPNGYPRPIPAGSKWIGYASGEQAAIPQGTDLRETINARLGIPDDAAPSLDLITVTGFRYVRPASGADVAWSIDRPLLCQNAAGESADPAVPDAACVSSAWPTPVVSDPADPSQTVITPKTIPLNTAQLSAPAATQAQAGTTATVNFGSKTSNAGGAAAVPLSATTTIPGAVAAAPGSLDLAASATVSVSVAIPAGTPAGTYEIKLTAAAVRSATASVVVSAATVPQNTTLVTRAQLKALAQQVAKELGKKGGRKALRGKKFSSKLTLGSTSKIEVSVIGNRVGKTKKAPTWAKGSVALTAGQAGTVKLAPTKDGKKKLKGKGKAKGYVVARAGTLSSDAVRVTIR